MTNQSPEQLSRDLIDKRLIQSGWIIQDKKSVHLGANLGIAVREYNTDVGPADYVLFVDRKPVGLIEAKREEEGYRLTAVEEQSKEYAQAKLKYLNNDPLPYVYESTGELTRFTNYRDPKPRSRLVFAFHRPETLKSWDRYEQTLRSRLADLPPLPISGLRDCQVLAINKLEDSFKKSKPKALIQMATGSGKTFTSITFIYRLLKYAKAKRILFLVDTKNLGEQAEQEFMSYIPNDDNRNFTELYAVHLLKSGFVPSDNQVYISTIQRLYSMLQGKNLEVSLEEENPNEKWIPNEPVPVEYNPNLPPEFFDFVVIDECHRSIYNLWKQVLEYFDTFQIGLTATPDNRTYGYFNQNVVSNYDFEKAVIDGILVPYDVFIIETQISKNGAQIQKESLFKEYIEKRERFTRRKFWEQLDEDLEYSAKRLDNEIVNPSQIRTIIKSFRKNLSQMFPDRYDVNNEFEVPKVLIFAKTDSHADDIIQIVREEFGEENQFCKKITYKAEEDPKSTLSQFRNNYYPRIAVTVDMIATGTDVKPLECLLFMRDIKSRNYFEQMKGRGTRTLSLDDLRKVSPSAKFSKDHFVIVDAVGVTKSLKTDSRPLEKKPGVALKDLLGAVSVGVQDEDLFTALANRLIRLDKHLSEKEKIQFTEKSKGKTISQIVKLLLDVFSPDTLEELKENIEKDFANLSSEEIEVEFKKKHFTQVQKVADIFKPELVRFIESVRKIHSQYIDEVNLDKVLKESWETDSKATAEILAHDFRLWLEVHKTEILALQIFYNQPYRRRELTYSMIKEVLDILKSDKPNLAPIQVWKAYEQLESVNGNPKTELMALISLIRKITGLDSSLTSYDRTVDKNFQDWVFKKQAGFLKFNKEQMYWLKMIKDYIISSYHVDKDDFELDPFNKEGGLGKFWQLFGDETENILKELNETLVA
ncbi:type III restriction enzyme, res subunit [Leptospira weilii serovar Topaz str. LT2116]|uniref:Type III restriction enzyme, res subunit n=1 Tax=Leptospira weilii serovar Topaz str. LT2116 TaxID=1088540 RepID=M3G354_9LEPT|nr:type III restriction enzyme, res subunit [Leptospira weilii serovar Topaz str. LT2116]